jgi:hypothetical protein
MSRPRASVHFEDSTTLGDVDAERLGQLELLAEECRRDRAAFPKGELHSFLSGYWQRIMTTRPDLAPFRALFFELAGGAR